MFLILEEFPSLISCDIHVSPVVRLQITYSFVSLSSYSSLRYLFLFKSLVLRVDRDSKSLSHRSPRVETVFSKFQFKCDFHRVPQSSFQSRIIRVGMDRTTIFLFLFPTSFDHHVSNLTLVPLGINTFVESL